MYPIAPYRAGNKSKPSSTAVSSKSSEPAATSNVCRDYWIQGYMQLADEQQKLFYIGCKYCGSAINTSEGIEYHCREYNHDSTAVPRSLVVMTITYHTTSVNIIAIQETTEMILQTTALDLAQLENQGQKYNTESIKAEQDGKFYKMMIRRSFGKKNDGQRRLLLQKYYEQGGSTSNPVSLLKHQLNDISIAADSKAKKQALGREDSNEASTT